MLDTGIAVSSISGVQFITGIGVNTLGAGMNHERVPVANPVDLRVVLDKVLPMLRKGREDKMVPRHTKNPDQGQRNIQGKQ
jgi:hypothetical protein